MGLFNHVVEGHEGDQFLNAAPGSTTKGHAQPVHEVGTRMVFPDGRRFVYVKVGGSALAPGKLYQRVVPGANYDELVVPTAAAAGDTTLVVTNGATAITLDQFKGGYLNVEDDTGEGYAYKIATNTAAGNAAACTVTLESPKGFRNALTTSTTVSLTENPYSGVIIHPSPPTAPCVGVAVDATPASTWGWLQTSGPCSILTEGTAVAAKAAMPSASVDGAVAPFTATGEDEEYLGIFVEAAVDTEYSIIDLRIT